MTTPTRQYQAFQVVVLARQTLPQMTYKSNTKSRYHPLKFVAEDQVTIADKTTLYSIFTALTYFRHEVEPYRFPYLTGFHSFSQPS